MIGIICFWDREATPYLAKYEKILNEQSLDYEIIFWSRVQKKDCVTIENNIVYVNSECTGSKYKKVKAFLRWRKKVIEIVKGRRYDQLIVLSTVPAVLLYFQLVFEYRNKYIFDIRDYTLEKNSVFKAIVMSLIRHSCMTPISSKGYMQWLDSSEKIIINHNITVENVIISSPNFKNRKRYNISFVGNVRLDTQTRALLLTLKDSKVFDQYFYGRIVPGCDIEKIKKNYEIENLYLMGPFNVQDKTNIFKNIDIINCVYANAENEADIPLGDSTPLPNRLYDALTFYRPIVASKGTYLADLVQEYKIGCCINGFDKSAPDEILQYLHSFNQIEFTEGCNALKKIVLREEDEFQKACCAILRQWVMG